MKFSSYLILRGLKLGGELIFGGNFVLVSRGAYIQGGLYLGFYGMFSCFLGILAYLKEF